jgi:uncharacterized damage-inducible protein DinB
MTSMEAMRDELLQESKATRRLLERVPADKMGWKPHEKSMTLGQLATHVATLPGGISRMAQSDEFDVANAKPPQPKESVEEILAAFDAGVESAAGYLGGMNMDAAQVHWRMVMGGKEIFGMPRIAMLRSILLNHLYHHRGQLTVYLRLLDVPLPMVYGPSADENPFR